MLIEFGGYNFFSFKEGFSISLKNKNDLSLVLAIKGANASGKTNIIKALSFLHSFVTNSFATLKPDEEIMIFSYRYVFDVFFTWLLTFWICGVWHFETLHFQVTTNFIYC